jgi:ATP-binding cassette subfamily C protein CydC
MRSLLSFSPLLRRHSAAFTGTLMLSLLTLLCGIALLGLSGWFLTAAFLTTAAMSFNLFGPSAAVRLLSLLRILFRYGERITGHDATLKLLADIRVWLFLRLKPDQITAPHLHRGDVVSRLTADVEALDAVYIVAGGPLLAGLFSGAATTVVLVALLPQAALILALLFAAAGIGLPFLLCAVTRRRGRTIVARTNALRVAMLDIIDGHQDIRTFGASVRMRAQAMLTARELAKEKQNLARQAAYASAGITLLSGTAMLVILIMGVLALQAGALEAPVFVGLMLAVLGSFEATGQVVRQAAKLSTAMAAASRLKEMADTPSEVLDPIEPKPAPAGADIQLKDIVFGYGSHPIIRGIDMTLQEGERVAIKGRSGSGKSTLAALLLRLADPQQGNVLIGGVDIRDMALADVRRKIVLLEQDAPVFIGSIRDNLLIGRPHATDDECWNALASARLDSFVRSLPHDLAAQVGEAGKTLSVGQARRLCLARTLISNAPVLVLDEPTSGLDRENEHAFWIDLKEATKNRTVLVITHAEPPSGTVDRTMELTDGVLAAVEP